MNTEQINELRKLAQAATPGPWGISPCGTGRRDWSVVSIGNSKNSPIVCEDVVVFDAAYIAAANPAAILALIQQRDELLAALKKAHQWFQDGDDDRRDDELHETIAKAEG